MEKSVEKAREKEILARKAGEGSFISLKKIKSPKDLVELLIHSHAYKFADDFAKNNHVLDIGCGNGYGDDELATSAIEVIGIDLWKEGIRYRHQKNNKKVVSMIASANNLPFKEDYFDLVVSFQVIEHISKQQVMQYLQDIKRVLKPKGIFIVTTPNKPLRLLPFQKPWDSEHKKEYDAKDLRKNLKKVFGNAKVSGLFGTKKAYFVEFYRVKQSPLQVYLMDPIYPLIVRILPKAFIQKFVAVFNRKFAQKNLSKQEQQSFLNCGFSLNDLQTLEFNLRSSIALYGVCRKD